MFSRARRASLLAAFVAAAAGCAPGASASPAPNPTEMMSVLPLRGQAGPSFLQLPDPDGGARAESRVVALPNGGAVVTGGLTAKGPTNQVLYYDASVRAFVTLDGVALKAARYRHDATYLPTSTAEKAQILVSGGYDERSLLASVELLTIDLANLASSTSTELVPLPDARAGHRSVAIATSTRGGKPWSGTSAVLMVGGCVSNVGYDAAATSSAILYELETGPDGLATGGKPTVTPSQPQYARYLHDVILLPGPDGVLGTDDDRVLVLGGRGANAVVATTEMLVPLGAAEVYEPALQKWSAVHFDGPAPEARFRHRLVRSFDGAGALVVGGQSSETAGTTGVDAIALDGRDVTLGRLSRVGTLSAPRSAAEATSLDDGRVLVAGGLDPATGVARSDAEILAPGGADAPFTIGTPRFDFGLVSLGSQTVLVFGGYGASKDAFGTPAAGLLLLRK